MLETKIYQLEKSQDALEQYTRGNSLRVSGAEEKENEDATEVALQLFNSTMNLENTHPVRAEDIDRAHRVGKTVPGKQRPLLVKFATYRVRQRVFRAKRSLNPKFRNSENGPWGNSQRGASDVSTPGSTHDGINATRTSSDRQIIFINEDLT